jgi:hypothetical protein
MLAHLVLVGSAGRQDCAMVRRSIVPAGYISAGEAALRSGYTAIYLAYLARSGRLLARRVRRQWFIDERALDAFVSNQENRPKWGRPPTRTPSV